MLQRVDVALRHAGRVAGVRAARLHLRHTRQGQRHPWTGRGMRQHVLKNGWEHVIVNEISCLWTEKHGFFCLLRIYAQISTWKGRGMRQHVLRRWELVIMSIDGKAWISFSLPDSCFVTNICAEKYINRTRHAPPRSKNGWEHVIVDEISSLWMGKHG